MTNRWERLQCKDTVQRDDSGPGWDCAGHTKFHHTTWKGMQFKLMNYFWNFQFNSLGLQLTMVTEDAERKPWIGKMTVLRLKRH